MYKIVLPFAFLLLLAGCAGSPSAMQSAIDGAVHSGAEDVAPRLTAADASRADGRFGEAMQIYQQVLVDAPASTQAQYGVAECLLAMGRFTEAKELFKGLESHQEVHAVALQGEGLAALGLDETATAEKALREASQANPSLWRSWNALGGLADRRHNATEAAGFFAKAAALKPNSAVVKNNIGYSDLLNGDPQRAAEQFRAALALDPKSVTIQNNLRLAIAATGNYDEAVRTAAHDQLPVVLNNVGYVAMQRGDLAAAEGYFARAMEASGSYATVTAKNLDWLHSQQVKSE